MDLAEPIAASGWRAQLALGFERRGARTVLARRRHDGPLVVQKPLYPEGAGVCHAIVVHPPGGIAGGDELEIALEASSGAHALLTTPGAGKWYRTAGPWARQRVALGARPGAALEWLPQETIVFRGAAADLGTVADLAGDACLIGWEILCLGRIGSGERFSRGACRLQTEIRRDGRLQWRERGLLEGGGALLASPAGLAGKPVFGTFYASSPRVGAKQVGACRARAAEAGEGAVTSLPGILLGRYLGDSCEAARDYFTALWRVLRPALLGREADQPRIWRT
jgi:urease accessory protein